MALKNRGISEGKPISISFRVSEETAHRLEVLGRYCNRGKTFAVEELIDQEYERIANKEPKKLKKIESGL